MIAPLFILAPPRSFTSITCGMIGCHPQLFGLAEVNLFGKDLVGEVLDMHRTRRRMQAGLLRSLSELAFSEQTETTVEAARQWLGDNRELTTAELFRTMQEWAGDRGLVDKSPFHVFAPGALNRIEANFPDARYIHLTRHPGDLMKSLLQLRRDFREKARDKLPRIAQGEERVNPNMPEKMWLEPHLTILEFLETVSPDRKLRIRGEDLLTDPRNFLTQIAEWLEIDTGDQAIEAMMHPEDSPFAHYGPANARFGSDPNFMERPELRPYTYKPRPLQWEMPDGQVVDLDETIRAYAMIFGY